MNLTDLELQELLLMVGTAQFHVALGITQPKGAALIKEKGLLKPVQYMRSKTISDIQLALAEHRSFDALADHWGVSESVLVEHYRSLVAYSKPPTTTIKDLRDQVSRLGSVKLLARLTGNSQAQIRAQAKLQKIDINSLDSLASRSNYATSKGRRGENYYAAQRGSNIVEDHNLADPTHPFDFTDTQYGRVNVKTSSQFKDKKKKEKYWKFSTSGTDQCDYVAMVFTQPNEPDSLIVMVPASDLVSDGRKSVVIRQHNLPTQSNTIAKLADLRLYNK
jgi:hypothetical protein